MLVKGSLWSSTQRRVLFLFDDLMIVAVPTQGQTRAVIEHVMDLQATKIYSHAQSFSGSAQPSNNLSFEIQYPGGVVQAHALSPDEKEVGETKQERNQSYRGF